MKVNELRIGSFLNEGNYIIKINGFTPFSHSIRCDEEEGCDVLFDIITKEDEISKGWACDLNDLTPIPLSEDWLVKLKFVKMNSFIDKPTLHLNHLIFVDTKSFEVQTTCLTLLHIKYIHQLQNLYHSLTGEELTIKTK